MSRAQANKELRFKMKFEAELRPKITALFKALNRQFIRTLGTTGAIMNVEARGGNQLEALLVQHYVKVGSVFSNQYRTQMPSDLKMSEEEAAEVDARMTELFVVQADEQRLAINRTTQRNMDDAARIARDEQAIQTQQGRFFGPRDVAVAAGRIFERRALGRVSGIVSYETQWPAESAKAIEIAVLIGEGDNFEFKATRDLPMKEWVTQTDSRVRDSHADVEGLRVRTNVAFQVGSSQLMWPGDRGRGAGPEELINCRCSAVYEVAQIQSLRRMLERDAEFLDHEGRATGGVVRQRTAADARAAATESDIVVAGTVTRSGVTVPKPFDTGAGGGPPIGGGKPPVIPPAPATPAIVIPKTVEQAVDDLIAIIEKPTGKDAHMKRFASETSVLDDFASFEDMVGPYADDLSRHRLQRFKGEAKRIDRKFKDITSRYADDLARNGQIDQALMTEMEELAEAMHETMQTVAIDKEFQKQLLEQFGDLGVRSAQRASFQRFETVKTWKRNNLHSLDDAMKTARDEIKELGVDKLLQDAANGDIFAAEILKGKLTDGMKSLNRRNHVAPAKFDKPKNFYRGKTNRQKAAGELDPSTEVNVDKALKIMADDGLAAGNLLHDASLQRIQYRYASEFDGRAYARQSTNQIGLDLADESIDTIMHEFAHHIEFTNLQTKTRVEDWFQTRISAARKKGEKAPSRIYKNSRKHADEIGWEDDFFDHYVGKVYDDGAHEILSMGVQGFERTGFTMKLAKDQGHLELIWSIMRGY